MSQKALTALTFLVASLMSVVVLVGLAQRTLDTTGVAVALGSVVTGIVGGSLLKARSSKDGDDG